MDAQELDLIVGYLSDQAVKYSSLPRVTGKQGAQQKNNPRQDVVESNQIKSNRNKQSKIERQMTSKIKSPDPFPDAGKRNKQTWKGRIADNINEDRPFMHVVRDGVKCAQSDRRMIRASCIVMKPQNRACPEVQIYVKEPVVFLNSLA